MISTPITRRPSGREGTTGMVHLGESEHVEKRVFVAGENLSAEVSDRLRILDRRLSLLRRV